MVRFNIVGHGFLDIADPSGVGFKRENQYFRFTEITLGRSTEFSVPMTQHNRSIMQFGEDTNEQGEMLRRVFPAQMVYDGGVKNGTIAVTAYNGESFKCVFTIGNAEWITALQNKKLADCGLDWANGVLWAQANTPVDANAADPTEGAQLIKYENGVTVSPSLWNLVPSVNVRKYLVDLMALLGIPFSSSLPSNYWMVSGSMKGGKTDAVTIASTAANNMTITQLEGHLTVEDITVEYATANVFGVLVGGGSLAAKGFKPVQDIKITMPSAMPICWLIKWDSRLSRCEEIASHTFGADRLSGQTLELKKGSVYFFAAKPLVGGSPMYGWDDTLHPYSFAVTVERSADLSFGEVWYLRNNHPDMTVFEFLKSVAVSTGLELQVDGETGVTLSAGSYGQSTDFKDLERVSSVDTVARRVDAWGSGTRKAVAEFDSEDYVSERIQSEYDIDNEQNKDTKSIKAKFSEGSVGTNGILIRDVDATSTPPKFAAKRWTLALAGSSAWLQRVDVADPVGYFDISDNSTMMIVKVAATLAEFEAMTHSTTWLWRGAAFVWTDANWSDGVMTMTLQRVSRREGTIGYDAKVAYLESDGDQYINLGIVPDDTTGMKAVCEYVASGMDVAGVMEGSQCVIIGVSNVASFAYWGNYKNGIPFTSGEISLNYANSRKFHVDAGGGTEYDLALGTLPFTPTMGLVLFGFNHDGTPDGKPTRLSAFKVTRGNTVVLDLIPVRVGSVGYMYDQIGDRLLGNDGTGYFIVGPDV